MPVSRVRLDAALVAITPSMARVLRACTPPDPSRNPCFWPLVTRNIIKATAGYSPTNSLNRLLNGGQRGLLQLGLIEAVVLDVDGVSEVNYRITRKGIECLSHHEQGKEKNGEPSTGETAYQSDNS